MIDRLAQAGSQPVEDFLCLLGTGVDAGSDGPDWLIGEDDVGLPVRRVSGECFDQGSELRLEDFPSLVGLSF